MQTVLEVFQIQKTKLYRHTKESILESSRMNAKNVANVLAEQITSARRIKEYQKILEVG